MNVRHIGDNFTSLLYIAVTSSVFLYKLPIREGGTWTLTHTSPHPHPSPSITVGHPSSLWRWGLVAHPPDPNPSPPPPPPNTDCQQRNPWMGDENCVWGGGGVWEIKLTPTVLISHSRTPSWPSVFGGGLGQGDGLPRAHATSWKGDRQSWGEGWGWGGWGLGPGGRWYHALHRSGEVNIMRHSNSGIKRCRRMRGIKLSAVGECAEWN